MASLLLIHGPNRNLLGSREPTVYGATRLSDIAVGTLSGLGPRGYEPALLAAHTTLTNGALAAPE